jgi:hypothetical protein
MTNEPPVPLLTPEQFQLAMKLESIFMPHARRQRDAAFNRSVKAERPLETAALRFVHYTSAEAALNIIRTRRVWMRNATCMADYREVQHGFDIFNRFFSDKTKRSEFVGALDASVEGTGLEAINAFNQRWNDIRLNTYITSVSEHDNEEDLHGRLSMWRAFGGNTARVALVLSIPWFSGASIALRVLFSPVAYLTENETRAVLDEVVGNIRENRDFLRSQGRETINNWVFTMLLAGVTCLKHEGFKEEREWRAIYSPKRLPSSLMQSTTEVIGGVPQPIYKIPLDSTVSPALSSLELSSIFDRLIIGPTQFPWAMFEAFSEALTAVGVQNASERVRRSGIPIRT